MFTLEEALKEAINLSEQHVCPYFVVRSQPYHGEPPYSAVTGDLIFPEMETPLVRVDTSNGIQFSVKPDQEETPAINRMIVQITGCTLRS